MTSVEPGNARSLPELLRTLGWATHVAGSPYGDRPVDGRSSWSDEIVQTRLRAKIRELNPGPDGRPWADDARIDRVCDTLLGRSEPALVEANRRVTEVLLHGVTVEGLPDWDQGRAQVLTVVDWDHPENNDLLFVTDFRLDRPYDGGAPYVVLDAVLFVNGIPLAVVEGVRRDREPTLAEAIDDLRAYTGQRLEGERESVPAFFRFVQVLVATNGAEARVGTISSTPEHFAHWRTVEPARAEDVRAELGYDRRAVLTELETLAAGVLRPSHLLDLVRNFTVFHQLDGRAVKIVARYQQFRAVHRMIDRLLGNAGVRTGRGDERGGVIWHTQGSGKSFTMAFLVRKMRTVVQLADFKVVVVVDRTDLREQLQESLALAGETPIVAAGEADARAKLADDVPGIVTIMVQHARRDEYAAAERGEERLADDPAQSVVHFPVLNTSERIVLIVDEAHRSQRGFLHARLRRALPNAARIGFTGTPLLRADRENRTTQGIFGPFIDQYVLRDSERDGATVPIRYEQRRADAYLVDAVVLDAAYEREIGATPQQRQEAQQRLVTTRQALESMGLIAPKARDMLRHWIEAVLPNGLKAQVVAVSRLATVRYRDALLAARDALVDELEQYERLPQDAAELHPDAGFLHAALRYLPLLRVVDFVPVISAGITRDEEGQLRHDPPEWRQWTDENRQRDHIDRFKQRLPAPEELTNGASMRSGDAPWTDQPVDADGTHPVHSGSQYDPWGAVTPDDNFDRSTTAAGAPGPGQDGGPAGGVGAGPAPIAFLIVKSMLLTGFDAPIEQVLYVDRAIRDVELLQAIARTNRPARHKDIGLVVDYAGVSRYLDDALAVYDESDLVGYKEFLVADEVPRLRDRHELVRQFLAERGIGTIESLEDEAVQVGLITQLADPERRIRFDDLVGDFLATLDVVLPRPEALEYEQDATRLGLVQYLLRRTYRDSRSGGLDPYRYGAKVRRLLDRHIRVSGIIQRIPPVDVSAPDFLERTGEVEDARIRALHMEHALRRHISQRRASDPARYESLSERLERILDRLRDDAEQRARTLEELIRQEREADTRSGEDGLDPRTERPIYGLLERRLGNLTPDTPAPLLAVMRDIVEIIHGEASPPHFLVTPTLQETLRKRVLNYLLINVSSDRDTATLLAEEILGVVRARWRDFSR